MIRRLFVLGIFLAATAAFAAGNNNSNDRGHRALIVYDGVSIKQHEGTADAEQIGELLGHFGYKAVLQPAEEYQPGGMNRYDAVFVVGGSEKYKWPADVLNDARARTSVMIWVGYGADKFLSHGEDRRLGLRLNAVLQSNRFRRVRYKGYMLAKESRLFTYLTVTDSGRVTVPAMAVDDDGTEAPYMLKSGNVWIVADSPFAYITERDRYLAFCDLLHDILGIDHPPISPRAMIRLEDVNPDDDADTVQAALDMFEHEHIPFQISLIPVFVDPNARREVRLSENPALIRVLHKAIEQGGTIVMHGFTHQYRGSTGDDFEFWDGFQNAPRADDSTELVHEKLTNGLEELIHDDLYPIAWETPHYAASQLDYAEFGRIFSTLNEETMLDREGTQIAFPYPVLDMRGIYIVPENIGYLPEANPDPKELIENARAMLVVRDGIASAFVHDFLDPKLLLQVVRGIKNLGYHFVSLRDFDCRVGGSDRLIATANGSRTIKLRDAYLRQFILGRDGAKSQESWSNVRQTGNIQVTLKPGPGEILVALGTDERPAPPPSRMAQLTHQVTAIVKSLRPANPLRIAVPPAMKAAVLWRASAVHDLRNDQASFATVFRAYGVPLRQIPVSELSSTALDKEEILAVPQGSAAVLSKADVERLTDFVRQGGSLILDGHSVLAEALGIRFPGDTVTVDHVIDRSQVDLPLQWRPSANMSRFHVPEGGITLAQDLSGQSSVAAAFALGSGKVLFLGALLDPVTPYGISRYPFLFEHALKQFGRMMPARQRTLELYFDPGLRQNISIEDLAVQWRRMGVRVIYAAAWVFDTRYTYDYDRLVRVCHANGILVYAWFELPQVTPAFYANHPEWREGAAAGNKYPSWRLAMNLENPECKAAAIAEMMRIVNSWAWDGVVMAELNYDGKANGDQPGAMAPMNSDVRQGFRAQYGFDPMQLFDKNSPHYWQTDETGWQHFLDYRVNTITQLHREVLNALKPFAQSGHEIIVTMLDSLAHPEVLDDTGVDSRAIVNLMREYPFFLLQVEDPQSAWTDPPSRYTRLGDRYRAIVPPGGHFMFDINVIPYRFVENTHLPLSLAVGAELAATVDSARDSSDRVALYGDATIRTNDLEMLAYAAAEKTSVQRHVLTWTVDTPSGAELVVPSQLHNFYREGEDWSYWRSGFVLLPPGRQTLSATSSWTHLLDTSALRPQVLQTSTRLLAAGNNRGNLAFDYDSPSPVLVCLNRRPADVSVDGPWSVVSGARELTAILMLPAGHHHVEVAGARGFTLFVDVISLISSSMIVVFGTTSILMLIILFAGIRIRRLFRRGNGTPSRAGLPPAEENGPEPELITSAPSPGTEPRPKE